MQVGTYILPAGDTVISIHLHLISIYRYLHIYIEREKEGERYSQQVNVFFTFLSRTTTQVGLVRMAATLRHVPRVWWVLVLDIHVKKEDLVNETLL